MKPVFALAIIFFLGCGIPIPETQNLRGASKIIWTQTYGRREPPPIVTLITNLDCDVGDDNIARGFIAQYGAVTAPKIGCLLGLSAPENWTASIAYPPDFTWSTSSLAHEFWHVALYASTGDSDLDHHNPGFGADYGHPPGGAVDIANIALENAGL
jgi:hypothetical protein